MSKRGNAGRLRSRLAPPGAPLALRGALRGWLVRGLSTLLLVTLGSLWLHHLVVVHEQCRLHGELVHAKHRPGARDASDSGRTVETRLASAPPSRPQTEPALEGNGGHREHDEHCGVCGVLPSLAPVLDSPPAALAPAPFTLQARALKASALVAAPRYRLAPKQSPPRA
jgi:hypothetical protein